MSNVERRRPLVIAHRGAAGEAPENTIGAFRLALEQGCDAIELDIHLSADGELIVCHDYTIDRTTTGSGKIREMTVKELKQVDAGRKFHEKYAGERIPLLEEVFDLVPAEIMINVEIKHAYDDQVPPRLVELMAKKNRLHNVVVSSFDHKCLYRVKQIAPEAKIGLLYLSNFVSHRAVAETVGLPVYSLHPHYKFIDRENIEDAVAHGLQVYPYTIDNEAEMRQAISDGVTGIITDYPGKLRRLLAGE